MDDFRAWGEIIPTFEFQSHFTDWYLQIFNDKSLRHMPWDIIDQFDDIPTLFQVMAWCRHASRHYLNLY